MVLFDEADSKRATVVVPDNKLSLAIGRRGQNVRLAAHLTGYRIDIKSASEYEALEAEREAQTELVEEVVEDSVASAMVDEAIEEAVTSAIVDETVEVEDMTKSDLLSDDDTE